MQIRLKNFSFRFAEQVLNSRLSLKQEIDSVLTDPTLKDSDLTRPGFNAALDKLFVKTQPRFVLAEFCGETSLVPSPPKGPIPNASLGSNANRDDQLLNSRV